MTSDHTIIEYLDGLPVRLASPIDLSFIHQYGTIFKVFDDQDSGNLCFGVTAEDGQRLFVKFAGAHAAAYEGRPNDAIARLRAAEAVYQNLAHPSLIHLRHTKTVAGGFAMVYDWVDAVCAARMYEDDHRRFRQLPWPTLNVIFHDVLDFHIHVANHGYVAIDFQDGSIMWDEHLQRTVICDIDFYQSCPCFGRPDSWGSPRFIAPEERIEGAMIDEVTNVYTMGATAFCLFADSDRSRSAWPLSQARFDIATRAVSNDRLTRPQSIAELAALWDDAA